MTSAAGWSGRPGRVEFADQAALSAAAPDEVGLDPAPLESAWDSVVGLSRPSGDRPHPMYPGAVLCYGHRGRVVLHRATGFSRLYAHGDGSLLPPAERLRTRTDTVYDVASITKLFTSILTLQQVEAGRVGIDRPVAHYLPEFARNGKGAVTVRMLLTHTSGFPPDLTLWRDWTDPRTRIEAVLSAPLVNPPETTYTYSDLNLIVLGILAQRLSGVSLDRLLADGVTGPLGMADTGYRPDPDGRLRIAATEEETEPPRGVVWGEVHDENAWSLDGVAGHAGVFSTAGDLAILAQAMLAGGAGAGDAGEGRRILTEESVRQMITNQNAGYPGHDHGLGFELDQRWYMGGLAGPYTAGHTGYTGTSVVIDFSSHSFVVLLTNRVHPNRNWGTVNPARVAAADAMARARGILRPDG